MASEFGLPEITSHANIAPIQMSKTEVRRANTLLQSGLRQIQQGRLEEARLSCERALRLVPRHPDALHLLGIIALQNADHATAIELLQQATAIRPDHPDYHANLAYAYCGVNRIADALGAFERAAAMSPNDPELQIGAGNCLAMLGRPEQAEEVFRRLIEGHPQYALAWFNLAKALDDQKRYEEACGIYLRVTQLAPRFAEAYNNLGLDLNRLGRMAEGAQAIRACLSHNPDFTPAYVNLANVLNALRRPGEAEAVCRELLSRAPGQKGAGAALGEALVLQGRWREALGHFETAIKEDPENTRILGYFATALTSTDRTREALEVLDRALATESAARPFLHLAKGIALLSTGRIHEGFAEYSACQRRGTFAEWNPPNALTTGLPQDLTGREVDLVGEQGLGDETFFLRYAGWLKARGCRINYYGNPKIISILMRCPLLDRVAPHNDFSVRADHLLIMGADLPHLLGELPTTPGPVRALARPSDEDEPASSAPHRPGEDWPMLPPPLPLPPLPPRSVSAAERLRCMGPPPYLGLTWRAGTAPQDLGDRAWGLFKEIPLETLATALRDVDATLVSLQRHARSGELEQLAALTGAAVHDYSAANEDLEAMLALLAVIDEYIGVSNTNIHLRASAGRLARVLVPWPAEWRWMASGPSSPWFPGFSLYRQSIDGEWSAALAALKQDLMETCSKSGDGS